MKCEIGTNLTSMHQIQGVKQLLKDKSIDFVEILIDNFLFCDPNSIRDTFGNSQVAFHIMRSHFIERRTDELLSIGKSLRRFNQIIQPMYISDHLAKFYHNNLPLPFIAEIDYKNNIFMLFNIHHDLFSFLKSSLMMRAILWFL